MTPLTAFLVVVLALGLAAIAGCLGFFVGVVMAIRETYFAEPEAIHPPEPRGAWPHTFTALERALFQETPPLCGGNRSTQEESS